ncbi:fibronectin type III domain-containing protein [Herbiconiux solani]|uniref:fibronectin type III domain-containing protein n=1 Tax=Herbiconiux solani TaxID=661329 RepID=UPI0008259A7C|nr:fibronectin type III domain-containing protein [Herbiconiux solani]
MGSPTAAAPGVAAGDPGGTPASVSSEPASGTGAASGTSASGAGAEDVAGSAASASAATSADAGTATGTPTGSVGPIAPTPLPASTWEAGLAPAAGQVLLAGDPAGIDFGIEVAWAPRDGTAPLGYRVELFAGRSVTNSNTLVARVEVGANATRHRVEGVAFGSATVTARVTPLDGAGALPDALVSDPLALPEASAGIRSSSRAGTPALSSPTADGFTATWPAAPSNGPAPAPGAVLGTDTAVASDPAPAGYVVRVLERRHDQLAATAAAFVTASFDVGDTTTATLTGLEGSSRYLAAVVAYDEVDGVKRFRASSAASAVPAWSEAYAAQTLGSRAPLTEWANVPPAPVATSARVLTWTGTPTTGRYTGGAPITGYRVELHQAGVGLVQTIPADATGDTAPTARFAGLTPGARYSVRVAAINANGVGELSDFGASVTTPAASDPGSRRPAFTDRAALAAAVAAGTLAEAPSVVTVEQGSDASVTLPWTTAQSGEAWWYGDGTFAASVTGIGTDGTPTTPQPHSFPTRGLPVGTHWLLFVTDAELEGDPAPAGGASIAVRIQIVPSTAGVTPLENAVLRWGLNDEANNGAYFGGCNFLSAGKTPDPGHSRVFEPGDYAATADTVSIQKPDAAGRYVPADWSTKCLDRTGAPLSAGTATPYGGSQFVMTGGTGQVEQAAGSAVIRWDGDVTVAYYGGMAFWYLSDPVLTVKGGTGILTATAGGFGTDMDDLSKWQAIPERTVTLATFSGVQVGPEGFTVTPDYRGVAVETGGGTAQVRTGADWGSFPQSFIDFQAATGQASYWYSSGGQADGAKPAQPFVVGYDAASFVVPAAPVATGPEAAPAKVPAVVRPPTRVPLKVKGVRPPVPAVAPAEATADAGATRASSASAAAGSVVLVESPAASVGLSATELMLLLVLIGALGMVVVVTGVGGGLVVLGRTGAGVLGRTGARKP